MALWNAYHGDLYHLAGSPIRQDSAGRIYLRDNHRTNGAKNKPLVVNPLKGIVDDYVAVIGQVPDTKVPPPGPSEDEQNFADDMERYHYGVQHASYMTMQMKALGWWNSVMGTTAGIVWPDFKRGHPVYRFAAPYLSYFVPSADEPFMLDRAIIAERVPLLALERQYRNSAQRSAISSVIDSMRAGSPTANQPQVGNRPGASTFDGTIERLKCFDKNEVRTIIGGKTISLATHSMDFCPVVSIPNILIPGQTQRAHGDIEQAVGLAQHMSFIAQAYEEYVLQEMYASLVVIGLMEGKAPQDIDPTDPHEIIPVMIGGDVKRVPTSTTGSTIAGQEMARSLQMIEHNTGSPQIRTEGQTRSGWTTGRGVDRMQGPYFSRATYRTDIIGFYLEKMNEMSVRMADRLWPKDHTFTLFGTKGRTGSPYTITMSVDQLQGYEWNQVRYSTAMGMDPMQRMVYVKQALDPKNPLADTRWGMEFLGIHDRPEEMLQRIATERDERIAQEVRLRAAAQGQAAPAAPALPAGPPALVTPPGGGGLPPTVPLGPGNKPNEGAPTTATAPAPGAAPSFALDPQTPPDTTVGEVTSGLDQPLAEQVRRIVGGLGLRNSVWMVERPDGKVLLVAEKLGDAKRVESTLRDLYGKRVIIRTSKRIPDGAVDISRPAPTTEAATPAMPPAQGGTP